MRDGLQTAENLFDDVLKNTMFENMPTSKWLEQGLCVDDVTAEMEKPELLKLISKGLVAVLVLSDKYVKQMEETNKAYDLLIEQSKKSHKAYDLAKYATSAFLTKRSDIEKMLKTNMARNSAMAKLASDPKQKALKNIQQEYESQKTQFKRRGYSAQFVREMASKYPVITDPKTIANLVTKLNKKNEHIPS